MSEMERDRPPGETSGSDQRPARRLAAAILTFDLAKEIASLKQEASWQRGARHARNLVEDPGFRLAPPARRGGAQGSDAGAWGKWYSRWWANSLQISCRRYGSAASPPASRTACQTCRGARSPPSRCADSCSPPPPR